MLKTGFLWTMTMLCSAPYLLQIDCAMRHANIPTLQLHVDWNIWILFSCWGNEFDIIEWCSWSCRTAAVAASRRYGGCLCGSKLLMISFGGVPRDEQNTVILLKGNGPWTHDLQAPASQVRAVPNSPHDQYFGRDDSDCDAESAACWKMRSYARRCLG